MNVRIITDAGQTTVVLMDDSGKVVVGRSMFAGPQGRELALREARQTMSQGLRMVDRLLRGAKPGGA